MLKKLLLIHVVLLVTSIHAMGCSKQETKKADVSKQTPIIQPATQNAKVLLVHSYHHEYEWVASITRGVRHALKRGTELELFYLDTKRHTDKAWFKEISNKARTVITSWNPDVVILADDNAQTLVGRHLAGKNRPFIVFCGVNAKPEKYGYPAKNVTGVLERPHLKATVEMLQQIHPSVKKIALLSDNSPTSTGTLSYFKTQSAPAVLTGWDTPSTFSEWKQTIRRYQTEVDAIGIYTYHTLKNHKTGESVSGKEVMKWTIANSTIPVIGFLAFAVDDGVLCGIAESGIEHGALSGKMANELLSGKAISQLPIITARQGMSMFNVQSAKKFDLKVSKKFLESITVLVE